MRRWTHVHSLLVGAGGGLTFARHAWLVFLAGVLVGLLLRYAAGTLGWLRRVAGHVERRAAVETHPCRQCGAPIDGRSRAAYCSPACREVARVERDRRERLEAQLESYGDGIPW